MKLLYEASDDLITISGGSLVTADIYGTQGTATGEGGSARYTCTADTLVIELDGLPPLTYHRVKN